MPAAIGTQPVFVRGKPTKAAAPMVLRAGRLSMHFCPMTALLRTIELDLPDGRQQEVLRGCYVAVRDHNWNTFANEVTQLQVDSAKDSFALSFQLHSRGEPGLFRWQGTISAKAEGLIRFEMVGVVIKPFRRNRIGFCVLHPPQLAGQPCSFHEVTHPVGGNGNAEDGEARGNWRQTRFPTFIAAHQPMKNLRAIRHRLANGLWAEVVMEGETFEMEDQRNWTDASFKTYCTPLELPFPVEVTAGEIIRQTVTLKVDGLGSAVAPAAFPPTVRLDAPASGVPSPVWRETFQERSLTLNPEKRFSIPSIGLAHSSSSLEHTEQELARLRRLRLAHLRVDLRLASGDWRSEFDRAAAVAHQIGAKLEMAVFVTDNADHELEDLFKHLVRWEVAQEMLVAAWLIFHDQEKSTCALWVTLAKQWLAPLCPNARVVSGTNMYFAELNRQPPPAELLDAVCYSINPQVHAEDSQSLVETLPIQAVTVESAKRLNGGRSVRVSPVTFRPRFNPNATREEPEQTPGNLPEQVDPRQLSLFGAAWTLGSLKYLALAGSESITYYETVGWLGVQESEQGSFPDSVKQSAFPSEPGSVFPLYHVLADVGEFAGGEVLECVSSSPLEMEALFLEHQGQQRLLLGSFVDQEQSVRINCGRPVSRARLLLQTAENRVDATRNPEAFRDPSSTIWIPAEGTTIRFTLPPYAIARLDLGDAE